MQSKNSFERKDGLARYVLGLAKALPFFIGVLIVHIVCSYVLVFDELPSLLSDIAFSVYTLSLMLFSLFLLSYTILFLVPAAIYMVRWFKPEASDKTEIRSLFFKITLVLGLLLWNSKAPFHSIV